MRYPTKCTWTVHCVLCTVHVSNFVLNSYLWTLGRGDVHADSAECRKRRARETTSELKKPIDSERAERRMSREKETSNTLLYFFCYWPNLASSIAMQIYNLCAIYRARSSFHLLLFTLRSVCFDSSYNVTWRLKTPVLGRHHFKLFSWIWN